MSFLNELRRRRVLSVAGAYIAIAWLVTEIASFLLEQAAAPGWMLRFTAIVFVVGFPLAVVLAWVIQRQPEGRWAIDSSKGQRKAVVWAVTLGVFATAGLSWLILPRLDDATGPAYQPIPNSVAILPLSTVVGTAHERSIADTLFAALESGLDQSAELILMDLHNLKERPADLAEFGKTVKVAALLTGRLLQVSGGTRIRMELVDAGTGNMSWSQSLEWDPTRIADTGTTIANGVLQAMSLPPLSDEGFTGTKNPEAYEAFLTGLRRASSFNIADLAAAMGDFQRAIDLDPEYVLAHVELAETIVWYVRYRHPGDEEYKTLKERATQALETAQALAPESADVVSALGLFQPKRELKIQTFKRALVLDPNHAKSYHRLHWRAQDYEEAERLLRKALELEPFNGDWHNDLASVLFNLGRGEEAVAEIYRSLELEPELVFNHYKLGGWAWLDKGRYDEAMIHYRKAYALEPDYGPLTGDIAGTYAFLGAWEEALPWMDRLVANNPEDAMTWFTFYQLYYPQGETDKALEYLQRSVDLESDFSFSLHALGLLDIRAGQAELALERWRKAFPVLTDSEKPEIDIYNLREAMYYAANLLEVGDSVKAEQLLQGCLDALRAWQNETFVRDSLALETELEIHAAGKRRDKTLALMRRFVVDQQNFSGGWMFEFPAFDFLRDDPEFQEIMEYFHAGLDKQLERVREMERNGELPPTPGIVFKHM